MARVLNLKSELVDVGAGALPVLDPFECAGLASGGVEVFVSEGGDILLAADDEVVLAVP